MIIAIIQNDEVVYLSNENEFPEFLDKFENSRAQIVSEEVELGFIFDGIAFVPKKS